ncbi:MAG: hypothetical protein P9M03_07055 [Candidatus Theseobacter exili]|nr:hypothetical protein [Candidatus Theseobacter exili]
MKVLINLLISAAIFILLSNAARAEDKSILNKLDLHGFLDLRAGYRTQNDPYEKDLTLGETRLQLDYEKIWEYAAFQFRSDFLYDAVPEDHTIDIEDGTGPVDLREMNLQIYAFESADIKIGRQILTWGTGDLIFINDLFPKDWKSFFIGRAEEYLKAPSDAIFVSVFPSFCTIDLAYMPRFDSDRYISGERISYWNPLLEELAGRNAIISADKPDDWFNDYELSLRISKNISGYEYALYGYRGFWKSPRGIDDTTMNYIFPELNVYGASLRGPIGQGIISIESGYLHSRNDGSGEDPFIPNSEIRFLFGYERELIKDLSAGIQYYLEYMDKYDNYKSTLPEIMIPSDKARQVLTLRLTKHALNQNLRLSLFMYYSPTDHDVYFRPIVKYKASDNWLLTTGANIFAGDEPYTFFGQFKKDTNVYAGIRYSF